MKWPPEKSEGASRNAPHSEILQLAQNNCSLAISQVDCTPLVCSAEKSASREIWVLVRVIDTSDPLWDRYYTIVGTPEKIRGMFDLTDGVPFGWRLLKGKRAMRWIRHSLKEEIRYQRDQAARGEAGNN
jgi:hypothetical protein